MRILPLGKVTNDALTAPPNGVVYDTPADIAKLSDKIMQRVVITKTMPQNNKTNMTEPERETLVLDRTRRKY